MYIQACRIQRQTTFTLTPSSTLMATNVAQIGVGFQSGNLT